MASQVAGIHVRGSWGLTLGASPTSVCWAGQAACCTDKGLPTSGLRRVRPLPPRPQDRGKGFKYARLQNARTKQRTQCLGKHRSSRGLSRWPPEQPSPGRGGGGCGGSGHQGLPRARPHRLCRSLLWPLPQHPAGAHQAPLLSRSPPPLWGQERAGHTHRPGVGAQPAGQTRPQPRRHTVAFTGSHTCTTLANTHTRGRT